MTTPVRTRVDVLERIREAEAEIRSLGVRRLALFGSFARSEAHSDSDVDLLVEFAPDQKSFDRFNRLYDLLEERLARHVELVTTEALSPYIGPHILAEAEDVVPAA
jgi:predicted nucleotidyltransferase